ncbi:hypothetical protein Sango_2999300 [Sesamum angolense]|uniref:Retrotransposon gag domain-containing protein n=1 Tax=Sesamum angolense TaxID=2727404 RepID=A0AAE1VU01_9LAMI|nr:hypothetical protein Sango_2999300 [Sesamum angolense]
METCTKYCSRVSSAGDVVRELVIRLEESWQSRAYEDCILNMTSGGCVVKHGHHKPYPVQSEDSEVGSIDRWEQLEQKFLNRFYSTRRTVSMVELTDSRQWKEEPVLDYINRSFEELATRAHDMELSMIASGVEGPPVQEFCRNKEKQEMEKGGKPFSKAPSKESMAVNVAPFKLKSSAKDNVATRKNVHYERPQRKLTLKEMQAREYPFLDFDVPRIFDDLLEANLIDLPKMKRPEEAERKDDPKYCKYHRLVGHAIQDCFMFKDKVM